MWSLPRKPRTERAFFFSQGDPADTVYYLQNGRAKLTVVSKRGKEATVTTLASGDFFGEESMAGGETIRMPGREDNARLAQGSGCQHGAGSAFVQRAGVETKARA